MSDAARAAYLTAAAAHAGFQATITLMVLPALARVRPAHWRELHDRHTRTVAPLAGVAYAAVVATGAWLLVTDHGVLELVAVGASVLAILVTLLGAWPIQRRLLRRDDRLLARLLTLDRLRLGLAVVAAALALVVVLS